MKSLKLWVAPKHLNNYSQTPSLNKLLQKGLFPYYLFFIILTVLVARNCFFWDTIQLGSKHAYFYYQNNLKFIFLPEEMDSGHIPAFGYTLAVLWKIFGKSLPVGHFFMLPFLIGIVYQSKLLIQRYFSTRYHYLVLTILLVDPTMLAQATLVTPDIPLVFFFLLLLNSIFSKNSILKIIAVCGLSLISMRGMMTAAILFLFETWNIYYVEAKKDFIQKCIYNIIPFLPGGLIAIIYFLTHYLAKGWIGYHRNSPWAGSFELVNATGVLRNVFIYGWRLLDFGRITLWILFIINVKFWWKFFKTDSLTLELSVLSGLFLAIFPLSMIPHTSLLAHRYLLPVYIIFALLVCYIFFEKTQSSISKKKITGLFLILSLLAGNLIIYPDKIAQGWDSSLAYLPYLNLRNHAIQYIAENRIPFKETGSEFPNISGFRYTDLKETDDGFALKDLQRNRYFLYSNIFNEISDAEYETLHKKWVVVKNYKTCGVRLTLFRNPNYPAY
jgi:hypothetical protein